MGGKNVKKSGAAATARAPIVRKVVKGTPSYMRPTLASKAKAMRRTLVGEEDPGWFDLGSHHWSTALRERKKETSIAVIALRTHEEVLLASRAFSSNVPQGNYEKLHSSSSHVHPSASSITSTASSYAAPSGGRSFIPRGNY
ncbi:hypothetical protein BDZ91DRAFT_757438 [Kalaharituber pfeilii]|nr:hypothetical protein BDZ91DRAFT_757438 [Kalaharituber pfeilii]